MVKGDYFKAERKAASNLLALLIGRLLPRSGVVWGIRTTEAGHADAWEAR
jgi:hypothetical protein